MGLNDYTTLYIMDDGETVPFGIADKKVPVEYFLKAAKGSCTSTKDGKPVLLIPKAYNIHTIASEYETLKTDATDYTLTPDRSYLIFKSVRIPVDFIVQEAPDVVFCDDGILKVPSKYSMDTILKKYNKRVGKPASVDSVDSVDKILEDREKTHGDFRDHAYYSQSLKRIMRKSENYDQMSVEQMEALDMIVHKIGRILAGNPDHKDHWLDIEGYAKLISRNL